MFNGVTNGSGVALDNSGGMLPTNNKPMTPLLNEKPYSAAANNPRSHQQHMAGGNRNMHTGGNHMTGGTAVTSEHIVTPQGQQQSYGKGQQQLTQNFSRMKVSSGPNK